MIMVDGGINIGLAYARIDLFHLKFVFDLGMGIRFKNRSDNNTVVRSSS